MLIPLDDDYTIPLRRAPDIRQACAEAYGLAKTASVTSLRALLGVIGAHEWRTKGIELPEAGGRIHPHFGVFAPIRREYLDLVSTTPLPAARAASGVAFDIGTGTGVLAAVLARRGIERVVATDLDPRALACARENLRQLGLSQRVDVVQADLFPEGRAALVICNPPWIPARPSSPMENAIYDPDSRMLRGFLGGLPQHL
ncbi:MAG TPA: class I SAM-dependent methyltransferase, partial [Steroidobacteraceae bacterium]|nr:class I SAM-dependent methyltransferase [Steroidobacteraceae bacterium]